MELIDRDLSEPYSIFTYRYFVAQWPTLCFLAVDPTGGRGAGRPAAAAARVRSNNKGGGSAAAGAESNGGDKPPPPPRPPVFLPDNEGAAAGVVVCKAEPHRDRGLVRGYLAMLVVDRAHRGKGLGAALARRAIAAMRAHPCDEIALEAEAGNLAALALYRSLGFVRDKRLHRYYLNGADAYRLKLLLPRGREALERWREERGAAAQAEAMAMEAGETEGGGEEQEGDEEEEERRAAEALAGLELAAG
jgi:peptide alpha-N-acetyltransferase